MPSGEYLLSGHDGPYAVERFTCGPDGAGWAYAATRHDPTSGALLGRLELRVGVEQRLHAEAGRLVLRAGTLGDEVLWRRGEDERATTAAGLTGSSPAFAVATARRLAMEVGGQRRVRLLAVTDPVLALLLVDREWRRTAAERYQVTDLATGERSHLLLDGDLVVEAHGVTLTRP